MIDKDDIYHERLKRINYNYNNDDSNIYSNHLSHDFAGSNGSSFGPRSIFFKENYLRFWRNYAHSRRHVTRQFGTQLLNRMVGMKTNC